MNAQGRQSKDLVTYTLKIAFLFGAMMLFFQFGWSQCGLGNALPIRDLGTQYGYIRIENVANDDLASAGQGLCAVNVRFRHVTVGDIRLTLSAPNGRVYPLIQSGGSRSTAGTLWDIRFVPCSETPAPDQGNFIKPVWDSDQDWGENMNYTGTYHAETCLGQINTGPVNGIWTITVSDVTGTGAGNIEAFSLEFCAPQGIQCSECTRSGGVITRDTVFACGGDPSLATIRIFPTYSGTEPDPAEYAYRFAVVKAGIIRDITQLPDLQSELAGDYLIYGISVANQDLPALLTYIGQSFSSLTNALAVNRLSFCAAFSSSFKVYRILSDPDPRTIVNAYVCPESPIQFNGSTITTAGVYTATLTSSVGCDSIVELRVQEFAANNAIVNPGMITCNNKPLTLAWTNNQFATKPNFKWYTSDGSILNGERTSLAQVDLPGTYHLAISQGGCADTLSALVTSDGSLPTLLIDDIVMNCTANIGRLRPTSNASTFSWSGPFGYTSMDQNIDVTEPGSYTVTAVGANCAVRKTIKVGADFRRPENVLASGGAIRCANDSLQLFASSTSSGISYEWSGPGGFTSREQNPWVYQSGIYSVDIGAGGCIESRQVEVHNLFSSPSISITGATLDCRGGSKRITTTVSDALATFQWTGPNGFSSTQRSPSVSTAGVYNAVVSDVNQCLYSASATVNIDTVKPTVTLTDLNLRCTQDDFTLRATTLSSLHSPNFVWTGPGNFRSEDSVVIATEAGVYKLTVLDPVNGCSAQASLEVFADPGQPVLITSHKSINCDRPRDTLVVMANCGGGCIYEWDGPPGFIDMNDRIIVSKGGNYNVKVTDISSGCYSWAGFLVRKDTIPLPRQVRSIPIGCTTEGSITLDNTNQIKQFEWLDTISKNVFGSATVKTAVPTIYTLQSTDINGCVDQQNYEVRVQDDVPQLRIITDSIDCARDSVVMRLAINNYALNQVMSYSWSFSDGGISSKANPRVGSPGLVNLMVVMNNGCMGSSQAIVDTDYVQPLLSAIGGGFACLDTGINLQLTADRPPLSTYWTGPNGFQSYDPSPLARIPGMYTLEILGYNGCLASDTALVYFTDPLPSLEVFGDTIDCIDTVGNLVFVTDAPPGYNFRWLDPGGRINNSMNIQTTLVGPYQLELTDVNGCRSIAFTEIEIDTFSFGHRITSNIVSCNLPNTQLKLDTIYDFLEYHWSFDSTYLTDLAQPMVDMGGLYILKTTNINGCQREIEHQVEADTVTPKVTVPNDTLNCENRRITLRPSPITNLWSYSWSGPGGFTYDSHSPLITGPGLYTVTATAANGCSRSVSSNISASFESPEILIDSTFIPCNGDSAQLSFGTVDQLKETNWFGPDGYYRPTINAATIADGWYYLLAKGFNGCEAFDSQYVSSVPLLEPLLISSQKIDCTHPIGFVSLDSLFPGYSYVIINQTNDTIPTLSVQTAEAQEYRIVGTHLASSCEVLDTIFIPADTLTPQLTIVEMDSIICEHREIFLGSDADSMVTYQWSTIDGNLIGPVTNSVARLDAPGTYVLSISSLINHCTSQDSILIEEKVSNLRGMYLSGVPASCDGANDAIIVIDSLRGGQGPFTFSLNDQFYTEQNAFLYLEPATYQVQVKDVNGCAYDTVITVTRYPTFDLSLGVDEILINLGDSLDLEVNTNIDPARLDNITWLVPDSIVCSDCFSQVILPTDNRYYFVNITALDGCIRRDTVFVRVADPGGLFVPNAFTPDGDGVNDFAEVFTGNNIERISSFEIFDRWGNNVFSAFDHAPGDFNGRWNGTYKGQELNPGVYIFLLKALDIRGSVKIKAGDITLIR